MRLIQAVVGASLCLGIAFSASAQDKFVQPTENNVGIFQNEIRALNEKPLFTVNTNDRLQIIGNGSKMVKIKNADGKTGYIEKRLVVNTGKNKTFVMDEQSVEGYLDNPTPVYILDATDANADPISLNRSFSDAMRDNVDRETVERQSK